MMTSDGSPRRLRDLSPSMLIWLVVITAAGTLLRIAYQWDRPFTGDEIGTLQLLAVPYEYLLTHFDGWLTMNYYIVLAKWIGAASSGNSWVIVAPSLIAGIVCIPLIAAVALRINGITTAIITSALVAFNPYLVFYSVQIRSYMLLTALVIGSLIWFLDWMRDARWRHGIACAICCALAIIAHPNAIYHLLFLACWFGYWWWDRNKSRQPPTPGPGCASLVVPMAMCCVLAGVAYLPLLEDMATFRNAWTAQPPTSVDYLHLLCGLYFVHGFAVVYTLGCLTIGLWSAIRLQSAMIWMVVGVVIPIACASWMGVSHYPWAMGRFFIMVVPLLMVIVAAGICVLARGRLSMTAAVLTIIMVMTWTPNLRAAFHHKHQYPWQEVAAYLNERVGMSGHVLTIEHQRQHAAMNLWPHLNHRPVSIDEYLNKSIDLSQSQQLFVITADAPIEYAADHKMFGAVQVSIYSGDQRSELAASLLADLRRSLNNRVAAHLTGQYNLLLKLMHALDDRTEWRKYTDLYYKCLMRTRRQRHSPSQILNLLPREQVLTILP